MSFVKTGLLNGIAVFVKMLTLLGINKMLAIFVGPSGYAIVGQFYNAVQMTTAFASGAINIGVVRYTAEHVENSDMQIRVWKTSGTIALIGSIICTLLVFICSDDLAWYFFKDLSYQEVFFWFGGSIIFFTFNTLLLSILNGKKEIHAFVVLNIVGSLVSLILTGWLSFQYKLYGSLIALGTYQSIAFFVTLYFCLRFKWFKLSYLFGAINRKIAIDLFKYTVMALTTAVVTPFSAILIRKFLVQDLSLIDAGYWEAISKFSSAYLMFLTSTLSVYYLPRISEIKDSLELKEEIYKCFKIVLGLSAILSVALYFKRFLIIDILFTRDFYPISDLFLWQLVGDILRVSSWVFSYVFLAKSFVAPFVFSEIFFSLSLYGLILLLVPSFGINGVAISYAINYLFYFSFVFCVLRIKKII